MVSTYGLTNLSNGLQQRERDRGEDQGEGKGEESISVRLGTSANTATVAACGAWAGYGCALLRTPLSVGGWTRVRKGGKGGKGRGHVVCYIYRRVGGTENAPSPEHPGSGS